MSVQSELIHGLGAFLFGQNHFGNWFIDIRVLFNDY